MNQLAFDISLPPNYGEENFLVTACNRDAWNALKQWDADGDSSALIKGPKSSGKTHLAHIWAAKNNATTLPITALVEDTSPASLFEQYSNNLVLDDVQDTPSEAALFHLLNHLKNHPEHRVLLVVDEAACWEQFTLPDLRSRLQALPQASIMQPDDVLLTALLVKHFQDRQVEISQTSLGYLLPRIERSFEGVQSIIEALDKHAIAQKKPITRSLIQQVLTAS